MTRTITTTFSGNVMLPTTITSPGSACLGSKLIFESYGQVQKLTVSTTAWYNTCLISLPSGVWFVVGAVNCFNGSCVQPMFYGAFAGVSNNHDDVAYQLTWYNVLASEYVTGNITHGIIVTGSSNVL